MKFIKQIEIDHTRAEELSELLTKKSIRMEVAASCVKDPEAYDEAEKRLIPIIDAIEAIKDYITKNCIPDEYKSEKYTWIYNGILIDGYSISIYEN